MLVLDSPHIVCENIGLGATEAYCLVHSEDMTCNDLGQTTMDPNDFTATLSSLVVHVPRRHKLMNVVRTRRDDACRMPDTFGIWACVRGL
jgi:hypothetical protein